MHVVIYDSIGAGYVVRGVTGIRPCGYHPSTLGIAPRSRVGFWRFTPLKEHGSTTLTTAHGENDSLTHSVQIAYRGVNSDPSPSGIPYHSGGSESWKDGAGRARATVYRVGGYLFACSLGLGWSFGGGGPY